MKKLLKRLIHNFGYDLHRLDLSSRPENQLYKSLQKFDIDFIFDIGANEGQFVSEIRDVGYKGKIVSFEPLSNAHIKITELAQKDSNWSVHERSAIGNYDGEVDINISGNSVSSSVLPMMDAHALAAQNSTYIGNEKASITRLDSIATQYLNPTNRVFIKIDTQGFEWQVLNGATETLRNATGVLCELSLVTLYEGQKLWMDMLKRFEDEGFTVWSILRGFTDQRDGRSLQINVIFYRTDHIKNH